MTASLQLAACFGKSQPVATSQEAFNDPSWGNRASCYLFWKLTRRRRQNFYLLPSSHQKLLHNAELPILDNLNRVDDAIDENADIADAILELALETLDLPEHPETDSVLNWHDTARPIDMDKAHSTIKQFWRDWSREGYEAEVKPIVDLILKDLSMARGASPGETRILLPGVGLGRLLLELSLAGYVVEGNEISYHQLFASNFILNTTKHANQYTLYPFITSFNNHSSRCNQLRCVTVPDVHPATAMANKHASQGTIGEMNMSAGDFITSYASEDSACSFEAVVTVYFIDTAPNVIRYIETIRHCLVEGGIWINIGPLLWHFEDRAVDRRKDDEDKQNEEQIGIAEPGSIELTDEEMLRLVRKMGFERISHEMLPPTMGGYIQDPHSMLQNRYNCSHWVVRKDFR